MHTWTHSLCTHAYTPTVLREGEMVVDRVVPVYRTSRDRCQVFRFREGSSSSNLSDGWLTTLEITVLDLVFICATWCQAKCKRTSLHQWWLADVGNRLGQVQLRGNVYKAVVDLFWNIIIWWFQMARSNRSVRNTWQREVVLGGWNRWLWCGFHIGLVSQTKANKVK